MRPVGANYPYLSEVRNSNFELKPSIADGISLVWVDTPTVHGVVFAIFVRTPLGRPDGAEELADLALEPAAFAGQRFCRRQHLGGGRSGLAGAMLHVGDVVGDLLGAVGGLLHIAGNFLSRRALLF